MASKNESTQGQDVSQKIKVTPNGPYLVSGGIPLFQEEIRDDSEGYCYAWHEVKQFPTKETYALCRCGHSGNKPFCDGTHIKINFDGIETVSNEPYEEGAKVIEGPDLILKDKKNLCVHARFCLSAGGIRNLVKHSDSPKSKEKAILEAANCPSGRLIVYDKKTGKAIEPELEKTIVVTEYPARWEYGPLWVRGGIPVESADGKIYEIRNRVTLCRCGRSQNKPFCDGSHMNSK
jgi:CDGSH-type Zn-finger protein/nitrite reductase/ring-hydroxylating ferredoxin subunit